MRRRGGKADVLSGTAAVAVAVVSVAVIQGCGSMLSGTKLAEAYRATDGYLVARESMVQAAGSELRAGQAAMEALVASVGTGCPGAIADANSESSNSHGDRNGSFLLYLGLDALTVAQRHARARLTGSFAASIDRLRWPDGRVTAMVQAFARLESERARAGVPSLCAKIKEVVAERHHGAHSGGTGPGELGQSVLRRAVQALGCRASVYVVAPEAAVLPVLRTYVAPRRGQAARKLELMEWANWRDEERIRLAQFKDLAKKLGVSPYSLGWLAEQAASLGGASNRTGAGRLPPCTGS